MHLFRSMSDNMDVGRLWCLPYLDRVLKFGILVVKHTEAKWFFRNNFHQHQVAALQNTY